MTDKLPPLPDEFKDGFLTTIDKFEKRELAIADRLEDYIENDAGKWQDVTKLKKLIAEIEGEFENDEM